MLILKIWCSKKRNNDSDEKQIEAESCLFGLWKRKKVTQQFK